MRNSLTIALVGFGLLLAAAPAPAGQKAEPAALIDHARSVLLAPDPGRDAVLKALIEILDASLLILPKSEHSDEFRSLIEAVKNAYKDGVLFSDKAYQDLEVAYKLVNGGKAWQIPEELKAHNLEQGGIGLAKKIFLKLLDSALIERKAGRSEESVRRLLDCVLLVITPIEA